MTTRNLLRAGLLLLALRVDAAAQAIPTAAWHPTAVAGTEAVVAWRDARGRTDVLAQAAVSAVLLPKPPLDRGRVAKEVAAGVGGGLVGIVGGSLVGLGYATVRFLGGAKQVDLDRVLQVSSYAGYFVGSAAGVYWVGNTRDETGSFLATLAGSAIGLGAPGATVGFNLTRRNRETQPVRQHPRGAHDQRSRNRMSAASSG